MNPTKYLGLKIGTGVIVGARQVSPDSLDLDVLDGGVRTTHRMDFLREVVEVVA